MRVPCALFTDLLKVGLEGMIRTETNQLALSHATTKLLKCHGIMRGLVPKEVYSSLYLGLQVDNVSVREANLRRLAAFRI